MDKDYLIKLYSDVIIEYIQSLGFKMIEAEDNEIDRVFYDFRTDAMIVPITVLLEYKLTYDPDTNEPIDGEISDLSLVFSCFPDDNTSYFDNNFSNDFESERLTLLSYSEIDIKAEDLNIDKYFHHTFDLMDKKHKEIATQIVEHLPSQEYFYEYYKNFANDYHLLETFLKANDISEDQLIDMYIRIDKIDKIPTSISDVFLF